MEAMFQLTDIKDIPKDISLFGSKYLKNVRAMFCKCINIENNPDLRKIFCEDNNIENIKKFFNAYNLINFNHFFYLIGNTKEIKKYSESLKEFLEEYYSFNNTQYNRLNELYSRYFTKKYETNLINIPIYKIETLFARLAQNHLEFLKPFADNFEIINLISSKLENLETIIEECSVKFFNFAYNGTYFNETNSIFNSIMKSMSDLENKIVDEYIWEKYKKHSVEIPEQNAENLVSKIKDLEIKMYNYTKESKSKHYLEIRESNDKIQSIYSKIKNQLGDYASFFKDIAIKLISKVEVIEKEINLLEKNEEDINDANIICSTDFEINENDFFDVKYKIKIIKNNKILLKNQKKNIDLENEIKIKDRKQKLNISKNNHNKIENEQQKKIFVEDYLYLDEKDIYNIVAKLYNYDLKILDKAFYVLDIEKGKLDSMEIAKQILSYNGDDESKINLLNEKYNELIELINEKIVNNIANIEGFFIILNNNRINGKINFSNKFYDLIIYIFTKAQDLLLKNENKRIQDFIFILSQAYYKEVGKKKIYILEDIKSHELYKSKDFWKKKIMITIEDGFKKIRKLNSSNKINQEKKEEIICNNLFIFSVLMKKFDYNKDIIIELVNQIFDRCKCGENCRKQVLIFINQN